MILLYPIYIPSKKRPDGKTFRSSQTLICPKFLFVEKDDYQDYLRYSSEYEIIVLDKSNQGIAYVRNCIKKHAEEKGHGWYWCVDDDIESFHKIQSDSKLHKVSMNDALQDAQEIITRQNAVQGALNYAQFAFNKTTPYTLNKRCLIATLNNTEKLKLFEYDSNCVLKEDIDFTMQILTHGLRTVLCNQIAFKVPVYGTSKGGCYDLYRQDRIEKTMSEYLQKKWGKSLLKMYLKDSGRYDVKINWKAFKK